ncbi:MAG: hypothetical protein H0X62_07350 [Bacteroidetes bacterium]|nr:hypothetical protein [Bacteroidota bacterium]
MFKFSSAKVKVIIIILLLFNAASAIYGGGVLVLEPDGSLLQIPLEWLEHSHFQSYLLPGIILFSILGMGSLYAALLLFFNQKNFP